MSRKTDDHGEQRTGASCNSVRDYSALRASPSARAAVAALWRSFACCAGSVERGFSPRALLIKQKAQLGWAFCFIGGESVRPSISQIDPVRAIYAIHIKGLYG